MNMEDISFNYENAEKYYEIAKNSNDYSESIIYEVAALECGYTYEKGFKCMKLDMTMTDDIKDFLLKYEDKSKKGYILFLLGRDAKAKREYQRAAEYFRRSADDYKNKYAIQSLFVMYSKVNYRMYSSKKAIEYGIKAIETGSISTIFHIANFYYSKHSSKAVKYYKEYLKKENRESSRHRSNKTLTYYRLGLIYYYTFKKIENAIKYFEKGIEMNTIESKNCMLYLGEIYERQNKEELALKYYKMGAKRGCSTSAFKAGELLRDFAKGLKYFKMGASINFGCDIAIKGIDPAGVIYSLIEKKKRLKVIKREEERKNVELLIMEKLEVRGVKTDV